MRRFGVLFCFDGEDREEEGDEQADGREGRECGEDRVDQDGHAGHALERAQRAQRAHRADHRIVAHCREEDGQPRERDDHKVELAPRVAQVRVLVHEEAVGEDL